MTQGSDRAQRGRLGKPAILDKAIKSASEEACWEAIDLLLRRGSEAARDLLRGRSAELAGSAAGQNQLLSLALDQAAASIERGAKVSSVNLKPLLSLSPLPDAMAAQITLEAERLPAAALEQLIIERCALLAPGIPRQDLDAEIWRVVSRVEVHAAQVHLMLNARGLSALAGEPVGINQARARLAPGDQVVADHLSPGVMRIVMAVRLKVRGGRTWSIGPVGPGRARPTGINRPLIRRLRAGHAILRDCGIEADNTGDQLRFARRPKPCGSYRPRPANGHRLRRARAVHAGC